MKIEETILLLPCHTLRLPGVQQTEPGADDPGHQEQPDRRTGGDANLVPTDELARSVEGAGRPRQHRFVAQVPFDVGGELGGRCVTAGAILFHRPHGDPVEIAAQLPYE